MKIRIIQLFLLSSLLLSGCFPSLYPLYTEDDLVFDQELIGIWEETDDDMLWLFEAGNDQTYRLSIIDDGEKTDYKAHLVLLDSQIYLDLYPSELDLGSGFYESHFLRLHSFYRFDLIDGQIMISSLNDDWIRERIESDQISLEFVELDDGSEICVSNTKELQEFVIVNSESHGFWEEPGTLIRK